jgi:hypothetical protein
MLCAPQRHDIFALFNDENNDVGRFRTQNSAAAVGQISKMDPMNVVPTKLTTFHTFGGPVAQKFRKS